MYGFPTPATVAPKPDPKPATRDHPCRCGCPPGDHVEIDHHDDKPIIDPCNCGRCGFYEPEEP